MRTRLVFAGLIVAIGVVSSGCLLRSLLASVGTVTGEYGYGSGEYEVSIGGDSLVAQCNAVFSVAGDPNGDDIGCLYVLEYGDGPGFEIFTTASLVSDFGWEGLLLDPLVVQVPLDATVTTATFNNGLQTADLVVTRTQSFAAGPDEVVHAQPGRSFFILELPPGAASSITATDPEEGHEFDFTLAFKTFTPPPIPVKLMFTVRAEANEESYYLPMLPCTTDFADIPTLQVGAGFGIDVLAQAAAVVETYSEMVCDGQVYDLRVPEPPPDLDRRLVVPGVVRGD